MVWMLNCWLRCPSRWCYWFLELLQSTQEPVWKPTFLVDVAILNHSYIMHAFIKQENCLNVNVAIGKSQFMRITIGFKHQEQILVVSRAAPSIISHGYSCSNWFMTVDATCNKTLFFKCLCKLSDGPSQSYFFVVYLHAWNNKSFAI